MFHLLVFLFIFLISARVQLSSQSEQAFTQKIVTLNMHQGRLIGHLRYTFWYFLINLALIQCPKNYTINYISKKAYHTGFYCPTIIDVYQNWHLKKESMKDIILEKNVTFIEYNFCEESLPYIMTNIKKLPREINMFITKKEIQETTYVSYVWN